MYIFFGLHLGIFFKTLKKKTAFFFQVTVQSNTPKQQNDTPDSEGGIGPKFFIIILHELFLFLSTTFIKVIFYIDEEKEDGR